MTLEEAIKRYTSNAFYEKSDGNLQGYLEFEQLAEWLKELKQLREQTSWIPVSERYPTDTNKDYLVCYEDGCITIEHLYFDDDGDPFFSEMELGVTHWMPLPTLPYKAESEG